jgi:hypothetical protein
MSEAEYQRKFNAALAELEKAGVSYADANPPYVRHGRWLGFKPRPLYYVSSVKIAVWFGLSFALGMGLVSFVSLTFFPSERVTSLPAKAVASFAVGLAWGFWWAAWHRNKRKKLGLSSWETL